MLVARMLRMSYYSIDSLCFDRGNIVEVDINVFEREPELIS